MFDDDELMELVWRNGEVVFDTLNQKTKPNAGGGGDVDMTTVALQQPMNNQLFIQENEMASWLLPYPSEGNTSVATATAATTAATTFSVHLPSLSNNLAFPRTDHVSMTTTTVIGSNETPDTGEPRGLSGAGGSGERVGVTSGDCGTSTIVELPPRLSLLKRTCDMDSEDVELEVPNAKKQFHGSSSTKRSRAAEVHNLSERRRRDRINEKMKALQNLIPRCNKTDKASMLDDAIEYLKSLQQTMQMMSMGYGMIPMMYPGVQQYMPSMPMGMRVETGMNRPIINQPMINRQIMPYPMRAPVLSELPTFPAFHLQPVSLSDNPTINATSHPDPLLNLHQLQVPNQQQILNSHLCQQYLGAHQAQAALPQNQAAMQQSDSKPESISEAQNHDDINYSVWALLDAVYAISKRHCSYTVFVYIRLISGFEGLLKDLAVQFCNIKFSFET